MRRALRVGGKRRGLSPAIDRKAATWAGVSWPPGTRHGSAACHHSDPYHGRTVACRLPQCEPSDLLLLVCRSFTTHIECPVPATYQQWYTQSMGVILGITPGRVECRYCGYKLAGIWTSLIRLRLATQ